MRRVGARGDRPHATGERLYPAAPARRTAPHQGRERTPAATADVADHRAVAATAAGSRAAHAQPFPRPAGVELRVGAVSPETADLGLGAAGELDLGYLGSPRIRALLGANFLRAGVDRRVSGADVGGTMSAVGGHAGLRFDPLGPARVSPYGLVTLSGRRVQAGDVDDPGTRRLLEGFYVGAGVGGGIALALDSARRTLLTAQAERVFVTNVGHWGSTVRLRFTPRGGARLRVGVAHGPRP